MKILQIEMSSVAELHHFDAVPDPPYAIGRQNDAAPAPASAMAEEQ
jgi:hypothetical protein